MDIASITTPEILAVQHSAFTGDEVWLYHKICSLGPHQSLLPMYESGSQPTSFRTISKSN